MTKILLVEDDNNLREIFEMRLQAEGYEIITAGDGEQALVIAMKEKPDLIVADVMMPHLSGFEMLETLRAAPGMKDTKVVMMTALGQAEDQARGEKLGVIKYLVKSQVTLEDFARVIREVLPPGNQSSKKINQESETTMQDDSATNPAPAPAGNDAGANPPGAPAADSGAPDAQLSSADAQSAVNSQINNAMGAPAADVGAPANDPAAPGADNSGGDVPVADPPADPAQPAPGGSPPPADTSGTL